MSRSSGVLKLRSCRQYKFVYIVVDNIHLSELLEKRSDEPKVCDLVELTSKLLNF